MCGARSWISSVSGPLQKTSGYLASEVLLGKRIRSERLCRRPAHRSLASWRSNLKPGGKGRDRRRMISMALSLERSRATLKSRFPAIVISISSPSLRSRASTTVLGRRTAKLLPHLATRIRIYQTPLYIRGRLLPYASIPSARVCLSSVVISRSTCFSVWAAVQEMRSRFCAAAGRSTGLM